MRNTVIALSCVCMLLFIFGSAATGRSRDNGTRSYTSPATVLQREYTPQQKISEKFAIRDSLQSGASLADTLLSDTVGRVYPSAIDTGKDAEELWKYEPAQMPNPALQNWWRGFSDPLLDSLISMAVANNYDIRMAARRMDLAKLAIKQAQSAYWPVIAAQAGWNSDRNSAFLGRSKSIAGTDNYFSLGVNASWEIDVFGRVKASTDAAKTDLSIQQADYDAALVSLCSQLADSYLQLRVYQAQLEVANRLSASQQEVLRVAEVRHECQLASGLDVSQAKTVCLSTQATVPALETSVAQSINAILVLTGNENPALASNLRIPRPIPLYSMPVDIDINANLLRRRPDVRAAEMEIASYAAQVGIAKKDFLPKLSLNASIGTAAHRFGDLFKHDALTFSVAPTLSWTIFAGMSRKYAVAQAKEQMMIGIDNYNLTVSQAAAEVDNAVTAYRNSLQRTGLLNAVLEESIKSFDYSMDQYKQGLSSFLNVVDAQINILNYSNQLTQERGATQQSVIQLYKTLGGGWDMEKHSDK